MMSIIEFAYWIRTLSDPSGSTVEAVRRSMRAAYVPLVTAGISLGAPPAIAQDREQVRLASSTHSQMLKDRD
jgi:hypothetical protein